VTGIVLGAVGLASVGAGSFFGLWAKSANDDASMHHCTITNCDPTGETLTANAKDRAAVSTVTFIIGAALLAAGVVLYLTAPKPGRSPTALLPSSPMGIGHAF
jgi:hypothetical protein